MSVIVYEKHKSPKPKYANPTAQGGSSLDTIWIVLGTSNAVTAANAALDEAPLVTATINPDEVLLRQTCSPVATGPTSWEVTISYGPEQQDQSQAPPEAGTWRFSFDTTGGVHKVTQSLANVWRGTHSTETHPVPDLQGAIGWDGKKINGVEIIVPKLEFEIEAFYAPAAVTTSFVANLARNTGKTNSGAWLGFSAGELLFLGAGGAGDIPLRTGTRVKPIGVRLKFAASENRTSIGVGSITVPSKKGWEYLWVRYDQVERESGVIAPLPVHAYVEQVYESFNFASLFGFGS